MRKLVSGSFHLPQGQEIPLPWGLRPESLLRNAACLPPHQVILSHQGEDMKSLSIWPEASFFGQRTWYSGYNTFTLRSEPRRLSGPEASLELVEVLTLFPLLLPTSGNFSYIPFPFV